MVLNSPSVVNAIVQQYLHDIVHCVHDGSLVRVVRPAKRRKLAHTFPDTPMESEKDENGNHEGFCFECIILATGVVLKREFPTRFGAGGAAAAVAAEKDRLLDRIKLVEERLQAMEAKVAKIEAMMLEHSFPANQVGSVAIENPDDSVQEGIHHAA